jgi:hypothetical protein
MSLTKATYSMINGAVFNVLDYGAKGDGITDDTAAITAAYDDAYTTTNGPGVIYFPKGTYSVTSLNFNVANSSIHFMGEGLDCTVLKKRAGTTTPVLKLYGLPRSVIISELEINGDYQTDVTCLLLQDIALVHVHNCKIWKADIYGIHGDSCLISTFQECIVSNNVLDGILFTLSATPGPNPNANTVRDCKIEANLRRGISIDKGSLLSIVNCDLESNGTEGAATTGAIYIYASIDDEIGFGMATIDGCWLENNQGTGIYIEGASGGNVSILNTQIIAPVSGASAGRGVFTEAGLRLFSIVNSICVGGSGTVGVNSENFFAANCFIGTLSNSASNYTINQVKTSTLDSIQKTTKTEYASVSASTVQNNTLFLDSSTGKLSFKDGAGVVNALY